MLLNKVDSSGYIAEFKSKFSNFAQKAPILLSFITSPSSVQIRHENSGTIYEFDWDFTIPVKSFIHEIKQTLSEEHYPRIIKTETKIVPLSPEEQAQLIIEGAVLTSVPTTRTEIQKTLYRIDKVIALKDVFILLDETTGQTYRYKMKHSSIFFLKNYRLGKFSSIEEAGEFFFSKSTLLNEIIINNSVS